MKQHNFVFFGRDGEFGAKNRMHILIKLMKRLDIPYTLGLDYISKEFGYNHIHTMAYYKTLLYDVVNGNVDLDNINVVLHLSNIKNINLHDRSPLSISVLEHPNVTLLTHNYWFYKIFNTGKFFNKRVVFLPMYTDVKKHVAEYNRIKKQYVVNKQYALGTLLRPHDIAAYEYITQLEPSDVLLLSQPFFNGYDFEPNKYKFFNSVNSVLIVYDYYSGRHATSQFKMESVSLEKQIVVHLNQLPTNTATFNLNTFNQFSPDLCCFDFYDKYNCLFTFGDKRYVDINSYSEYIYDQLDSGFTVHPTVEYANELAVFD